jgi:glutamate-1-semialdehyde 2,1-aminomutase
MRVSLGGAQEYLKIVPDISIFSKALSNGYPFAAVVGKKHVMQACENLWFAGTNCGNAVGMSAALATLRESRRVRAHEHIWRLGEKIVARMRQLIDKYGIHGKIGGVPAMPYFIFLGEMKEKKRNTGVYLSELIKRGVFMPIEHCFYISYSHTENDIDETLEAIEHGFKKVKSASN